MPTYEYACRKCGEHLEVQQSFTDAALTDCPACAGPLRKVFGNIAITFKGSGFYKTDSRNTSSASTSDKSESKTGDSKNGDSGAKPSESTTAPAADAKPAKDSKPAAAKPATEKAAS